MIIGACGYGATGSSAVKDLLKEFSNVQVLDRAESMFAFKVDGLQDLEFHLMKQYSREISGDIAIKRFRDQSRFANTPFVKKIYLDPQKYKKDTDIFLDSIIQTYYMGMENADYENVNRLQSIIALGFKKFIIKWYEQISGKPYRWWPMRRISVSICPDNFYSEAKLYMRKIIENGGGDLSKIIVLDQPFEGNNPTQSFPFFDDPYAIVVDRDPRDLYIGESYKCTAKWLTDPFLPRRDPQKFVEYFKRQRMNIDYSKDNEHVLRIRLEDMIFDYENTIKKIISFLGLSDREHVYKQKYFKPYVSIRGTQLYKKVPGHNEELKIIERELKEFLYDFDQYELSKSNTELSKTYDWQSEEDKL